MKKEYLKPRSRIFGLRLQANLLTVSFDPDDDTEKWEIEDEEDL